MSEKAGKVLRALENGFLLGCTAILLLVGLIQLVMRNLFHTGVLWFEPLARYLLVWIAFAGAFAATGEDRHIRIDLVPRLTRGRMGLVVRGLTHGACAVVSAILAREGFLFLADERQMGHVAFLGVPTWVALVPIPAGFGLMGVRFALKAFAALRQAARP